MMRANCEPIVRVRVHIHAYLLSPGLFLILNDNHVRVIHHCDENVHENRTIRDQVDGEHELH
jgi:hypothetical protein